jgi:tetratricopeptide (TPR) repeat protein
VRERLARLYEAQGQTRSALAELRMLLSQAPNQAEELRLLREIVRLDNKDEAATNRLRTLSTNATSAAQDEDDEPEISVSSSSTDDTGLRRVVPSDADTTSRMPLDQFQKFVQSQNMLRTTMPPTSQGAHFTPASGQAVTRPVPIISPAPSQATQPNAEVVAAAAEEMALTSGTLKEELDEVDFFLQQKMYDEAQQLLKSLLTRYPHSKTVQAKQKEVASQAVVDDVVIDVDVDDMRELDSESTARLDVNAVIAREDESRKAAMAAAAAKKPVSAPAPVVRNGPPPTPMRGPGTSGLAKPVAGPGSSGLAKPVAGPGTSGLAKPVAGPLPVSAPMPASTGNSGRHAAVPSSTSLSPGIPASGRSLPGSGPNYAASTEASGAFRLGVSYRNRGQYGQAVTEFQKALADQKRAARAALMLGLCYRDQNQLKEAIEAFKEGVHMPGISDPDLGELHYQLGRSYEQLGDTGEAVHFYQLALRPTGRFKDADSRIATLQGKSTRSLK